MNDSQGKLQRRFWLLEIWEESRTLFKALVGHALITGLFLGLLWLFSLAIENMRIPEGEKETFSNIHYYGNIITFMILLVGFVAEVAVFTVRRLRK